MAVAIKTRNPRWHVHTHPPHTCHIARITSLASIPCTCRAKKICCTLREECCTGMFCMIQKTRT